MSVKSHVWDNAVVKKFFSTLWLKASAEQYLELELELYENRRVPISPQRLHRDLVFWIEGNYNRVRRHSSIGYLSPIDYAQKFIAALTLT